MGIAFDFPGSPATGDVYAPAGGPIWRWNGFAWEVAASSSGSSGPVLEAPLDGQTYGRRNAAWALVSQSIFNLGNYANDAAAAAGGVPINGLYRNGSIVQVRVA